MATSEGIAFSAIEETSVTVDTGVVLWSSEAAFVSGATDMKVTFTDSTQVAAAVKGTDSATDLAIIAVKLSDIPSDTMSKIKVSTLGDSDHVKVGEQVIAIGNALGYGQSLTVGYISALDREITD